MSESLPYSAITAREIETIDPTRRATARRFAVWVYDPCLTRAEYVERMHRAEKFWQSIKLDRIRNATEAQMVMVELWLDFHGASA